MLALYLFASAPSYSWIPSEPRVRHRSSPVTRRYATPLLLLCISSSPPFLSLTGNPSFPPPLFSLILRKALESLSLSPPSLPQRDFSSTNARSVRLITQLNSTQLNSQTAGLRFNRSSSRGPCRANSLNIMSDGTQRQGRCCDSLPYRMALLSSAPLRFALDI